MTFYSYRGIRLVEFMGRIEGTLDIARQLPPQSPPIGVVY